MAKEPKMGRPKAAFNAESLRTLCEMQATRLEVCAVMQISESTLDVKIKELVESGEFPEFQSDFTFKDVFRVWSAKGKASLRRKVFAEAWKDNNLLKFLAKNYLGLSETPELAGLIDNRVEEVKITVRKAADNDPESGNN